MNWIKAFLKGIVVIAVLAVMVGSTFTFGLGTLLFLSGDNWGAWTYIPLLLKIMYVLGIPATIWWVAFFGSIILEEEQLHKGG
jgi:hypothetical protein